MRVIFRADASLSIGCGHVMRCLTLANTLNEKGATVEFICRVLPGNLIVYIENQGFTVHSLLGLATSKPGVFRSQNNLSHSHWLGVSQEQDVKESKAVLKAINPDWLIVDHYAIDCWWQNQLNGYYKKLMVIDDLADRRHECDLLLDQTYGREKGEYKSLVPQSCHMLIGSQYALLRPEFSYWREYSLKRRAANPELKKILITMGGVDANDMSGGVLEMLKICELPDDITVTVVMGAAAQHLNRIKCIAQDMPFKVVIKANVSNMAELMANADVAVGASGSTTWERCCLGLPSIQVVLADNQIVIARTLSSMNVIKYSEDLDDLKKNFTEIRSGYRKMSLISSVITDGAGCEKVADFLCSSQPADNVVMLKPVAAGDCEFIYNLQTPDARKYSRNPKKPGWQEHEAWFSKIMKADDTVLFLVLFDQVPVGFIRLDGLDSSEMEISIIISPDSAGRGVAKRSLLQIFKLLPDACFKAVIHRENMLSQNVFMKLGFDKVNELGDFNEYTRKSSDDLS